jgi:hypothetical protein
MVDNSKYIDLPEDTLSIEVKKKKLIKRLSLMCPVKLNYKSLDIKWPEHLIMDSASMIFFDNEEKDNDTLIKEQEKMKFVEEFAKKFNHSVIRSILLCLLQKLREPEIIFKPESFTPEKNFFWISRSTVEDNFTSYFVFLLSVYRLRLLYMKTHNWLYKILLLKLLSTEFFSDSFIKSQTYKKRSHEKNAYNFFRKKSKKISDIYPINI